MVLMAQIASAPVVVLPRERHRFEEAIESEEKREVPQVSFQ